MRKDRCFFHDAYLNSEANSSSNSHLSICNDATHIHADESVGLNVNLGQPTKGFFSGDLGSENKRRALNHK